MKIQQVEKEQGSRSALSSNHTHAKKLSGTALSAV